MPEAVHAHDSYRPPRLPPLALTSVHAHGVVPHLLLPVHRSAVGRYMNIPETPGLYLPQRPLSFKMVTMEGTTTCGLNLPWYYIQ